MTDGTLCAFAAECTSVLCSSSACATPFNISTMARRTAVTLIGSYVAFKTRTGSCISEARRFKNVFGYLLTPGLSEAGAAAPVLREHGVPGVETDWAYLRSSCFLCAM